MEISKFSHVHVHAHVLGNWMCIIREYKFPSWQYLYHAPKKQGCISEESLKVTLWVSFGPSGFQIPPTYTPPKHKSSNLHVLDIFVSNPRVYKFLWKHISRTLYNIPICVTRTIQYLRRSYYYASVNGLKI